MRGRWNMMDWEMEKWCQELSAVLVRLSQNESYVEDFTRHDVCPSNLIDAMENLGWEEDNDCDRNGWQGDTWHYFSHPDWDFVVVLYYQAYTFTLQMYRYTDTI